MTRESGKEKRAGVGKLGGSRLEMVESGKEWQVLNSVDEEIVKEKRVLDLVEEEAVVECCKEVGKLGSQGGLRFKEGDLEKERLYRSMLEEHEKELTYSRTFTRALTDKGGKLANSIRRESGAYMDIIPSFGGGKEKVVLRGPAEKVNKAEQMMEELLSSVVEIYVSDEEKEALLRGGGKNKVCIMDKISHKISVPSAIRRQEVLIYGKPEETRVAKEIFEEELELVKEVLSNR